MKQVLAPACLAAVFAVGLSAQVPSSQAPSSTTTQTQTEKQPGSVTLTGCVRAGEQPDSFVLANVSLDKEKPAATTSSTTVGTTGTGAPAASATATTTTTAPADLENSTVKLSGSPSGVTLSDHVGHMVQITGTLSPEGASSTSATTTTGTTGTTTSATTTPAAAAATAQRTLNVTSLTMVSATCEK